MNDVKLFTEFAAGLMGLFGWVLVAMVLAGIPWAVLLLIAKAVWSLW